MPLTRNPRFIALIIILAVTSVIRAQVPVEVSGEKIVSGGKVYYLHEVQKNQTLYSISKAYRVTVDALTRENVIPPNGIQTGQVLRVPAADQQAAATQQPRSSVQQPTTASATRPAVQSSRQAPVSGVPGISISNEKIVSGGKTFFMHEVQKGQTLYSIAKAYKVTILDIDRENSIPAGGIREGQVLKIPASSALVVTEENIPAAEPAAAGTESGGKAATTRQTEMPRQETTRQETQLPLQEQTTSKPDTAAQQQAQQQTPAPGRSDDKPKPVQPEKKKIHKVQKGESLADIAKKYGITVQELKQANKGVIFAMPDMRLVIPVKEEE
jgi:LysM repeat protein